MTACFCKVYEMEQRSANHSTFIRRFGANDAAARASAATVTATERMKEGMAGSLAAMKRLNLGFKRSSQQES